MSTHFLLSLATIAFVLQDAEAQAVGRTDTQQLAIALQSPDASQRHAALEGFAAKVSHALSPGNRAIPQQTVAAINEAMPLLGRALEDSNPEVRSSALGCLVHVAIRERAITDGVRADRPDLTTEPSIKQSLIKLMSDPDGDAVRAPATWIYGWSFQPTPELEQQWMSNFTAGDGNESNAIFAALLGSNSPSTMAIQFALQKLKDPSAAPDATAAIISFLKPPPAEALPLLVEQFANSDQPFRRSLLAQAIPKFGEAGRAYLPLLRQMLARETDPLVKQHLGQAISSLTDSSPGRSQTAATASAKSPSSIAASADSGLRSGPPSPNEGDTTNFIARAKRHNISFSLVVAGAVVFLVILAALLRSWRHRN